MVGSQWSVGGSIVSNEPNLGACRESPGRYNERGPALVGPAGEVTPPGEVSEWLIELVSKTSVLYGAPRVRIPPSPFVCRTAAGPDSPVVGATKPGGGIPSVRSSWRLPLFPCPAGTMVFGGPGHWLSLPVREKSYFQGIFLDRGQRTPINRASSAGCRVDAANA